MDESTTAIEALSRQSLEEIVSTKLGLKTTAARECLTVALENILLIDKKNQDYGQKNIANHGLHGIIVRMDDKFERMRNLFTKKRKKPINESLRDTLRDVSNYAIIALVFDSGKWPKE